MKRYVQAWALQATYLAAVYAWLGLGIAEAGNVVAAWIWFFALVSLTTWNEAFAELLAKKPKPFRLIGVRIALEWVSIGALFWFDHPVYGALSLFIHLSVRRVFDAADKLRSEKPQ